MCTATFIVYRKIYGLPWITIFGHEWGDSGTILMSDTVTSENCWRIRPEWPKHCYSRQPIYLIYFLCAFLVLKHRKIDENTHGSIAPPLFFTIGLSVVVLWLHANTYYDVFWAIVFRMFLSGPRASFHCRPVDYHSLIDESDSRHFHRLACTKYPLCIQYPRDYYNFISGNITGILTVDPTISTSATNIQIWTFLLSMHLKISFEKW